MTDNIAIQGIYASAVVADFEAALGWYETFMGRPADDKPIAGMAQWRNMGAAGLQIWQDGERAGGAIITIVVPDLAREKDRLTRFGIVFGNEAAGAFGKVATVIDPEGNRINFAEPPKGSGKP